jgi:hypothetical protein
MIQESSTFLGGGELAPIVRPDMAGRAMMREQVRQTGQNVVVTQPAGNLDRQALQGELVDHGEYPEHPAVVRPCLDEVIGPDIVPPPRLETDT